MSQIPIGWWIERFLQVYPWKTTGAFDDGTVYQLPAQSYFTKKDLIVSHDTALSIHES